MVTPKDRLNVIKRVKALVLTHHFNVANIDYEAWLCEADRRAPVLAVADDLTFETGVRELLAELKSSHTNFYRSDAQPTKPQHAIGATLRSVKDGGSPHWMFLDVYEQSPAAVAGIHPGDILVAMDGKEVTPPVDPAFRFGEIHKLTVGSLCNRKERELTVPVPAKKPSKRRPPLVEPQSVAYQMLNPGVGLLKLPFFSGAFGIRFSRLLDRAIEGLKAQGSDRLIVDLRGCLGGSLGFAHLVSYFCPGRIPIGYDITRKKLRSGYDAKTLPRVAMPRTRLGVIGCLLRFCVKDKSLVLMTQGLGNQPFHGKIVVLINEWTNSAGEMAAQFAKDTGLATVVGQKTMGNVLGSTMLDAGHGYRLYLPIFGWYSPNGVYTEGSGVEPDVTIDIDPAGLAFGQDAQLEKALEIIGKSRLKVNAIPG